MCRKGLIEAAKPCATMSWYIKILELPPDSYTLRILLVKTLKDGVLPIKLALAEHKAVAIVVDIT